MRMRRFSIYAEPHKVRKSQFSEEGQRKNWLTANRAAGTIVTKSVRFFTITPFLQLFVDEPNRLPDNPHQAVDRTLRYLYDYYAIGLR